MLKNILCTLTVVATIASAAVGGTFAHFSDTEEVFDNYVSTASLDLKVSDILGVEHDQLPYGDGIPAVCAFEDIVPEKSFDFYFDLHNASQMTKGNIYIHFKNPRCEDIEPMHNGVNIGIDHDNDPSTPSKTEPELVAEQGGWVGQTWVNGIGDIPCWLSRHIKVMDITVTDKKPGENPTWTRTVDLTPYDTDPKDGVVKLNELICHNIKLPMAFSGVPADVIPACNTIYVDIHLFLQDVDEDTMGVTYAGVDNDGDGLIDEDPRDGIDNDNDGKVDEDPDTDGNAEAGDPGIDGGYFDRKDPEITKLCWDRWPSNAYQKDKLLFDILFSIVQFDP